MKVTYETQLVDWLDALAEHYSVIAPQPVEDAILYQPITAGNQARFAFERSLLSPKTHFLPNTEVLMHIVMGPEATTISEPGSDRDQIIFAIRPCDVQGLHALDAFLLDHAPSDAYYASRRERSLLIGLACPQLWADCFCTSMGSSPDDPSGTDVMLIQQDDGAYLVEPHTDRGIALLESLETLPSDGNTFAPEFGDERLPLLPAEAWPTLFDHEYWSELADRCLSCHACTYVCPTCRCFDVRDSTVAAGSSLTQVQRVRAWDSCLAAAYRRIAGGHNPRPLKAQRLRNRFYCKFCYGPLEFGSVACVGCGRCIAVCPVGIDITEVLAEVGRLGSSSGGVANE